MKRKILGLLLMMLFIATAVFARYDKTYQSWEVRKDKNTGEKIRIINGKKWIMVRFRINIPYVKAYAKARKDYVTTKAASVGPDHKYYTTYTNNIGYYGDNHETMTRGKTLKSVRVFGDFNGWFQQLGGAKTYKLIPSNGNPDTWYTKKLVPFRKYNSVKKNRYKFILDYGTKVVDGVEADDFAYIEDPKGDSKGDDGFGGFNSTFKY